MLRISVTPPITGYQKEIALQVLEEKLHEKAEGREDSDGETII
jgi:hypothetical protein